MKIAVVVILNLFQTVSYSGLSFYLEIEVFRDLNLHWRDAINMILFRIFFIPNRNKNVIYSTYFVIQSFRGGCA